MWENHEKRKGSIFEKAKKNSGTRKTKCKTIKNPVVSYCIGINVNQPKFERKTKRDESELLAES